MIERQLQHREAPEITIALANDTNARLLERFLSRQYNLRHGLVDNIAKIDPSDVDLIVIDGVSWQHKGELIRGLRQRAAPVILPVLLVIDGRIRPHPHVTAELGKSVDDIIRTPTSQAELQSRIGNLLRLRALSRQQDDARRQLVGVVSALRTLNACDRVVVRAKSEEQLLKSLCRTIVDEEGYSLAWIGFAADPENRPVDIRACAGPAAAFVAGLKPGWGNDQWGTGTVGQTIRTNRIQIVADIASDSALPHLHSRARAHGLAAAIILPLMTESGPPGCLAIYSKSPGHFGQEERQLLERLADNLVFGLNSLRLHGERDRQAAEIHSLAYTDVLTGLPNRRYLIHYLHRMLDASTRDEISGAFLFIDLDGFKLINDALGHEVGDQVLVQVGQRLKGAVRDVDQVIRQGGDEFLVVMANDPRHGGPYSSEVVIDNVHSLAKRIISHLGEPLMAGGHSHRIKASVGISLCPEHGRDAAILIENADKAMFEAKRQGGGRSLLFSETISASRQQRFCMEASLHEALEQQQFELYYQPVFELDSRRIVAVEALIRWPQADGGLLMPGAFMPLVEEIGLINPLGDWVLETAARQLRAWHDLGLNLAMSVNVSINQLYPDGNAEHFAALVRPHIDPAWIHLEVTENALMTDPSVIETLLAELHDTGFQLAIDDFGTGYSSLSRLQHLPIQTLKIDRSFVGELGRPGSKGAALVPIIQQMAHNLNLHTVAEGIETEDQHRLLLSTSIGMGWGQGFWFSPALPAQEMERWLQTDSNR